MDFSSLNPRSSNALSLAARKNDVENVRRLLKKINPNCVDNRGWTCLHEAAFYDSLESLILILDHPDCRPLVESHEGHTALYVACQNTFFTRCIKHLLQNVDDIANYGSREGFTPLHLVSRQGRDDVVQLLIEYGAIMDVIDFDGDTPLHEACLGRQHEAINILLHAGASPEIKNERKVTPFHMACSRGCLRSVKNLFPFITDINIRDGNGDTPLIAACHGENEYIIQFLLNNGANPNLKNYFGKMALDFAMEKGLVLGFKLLFETTKRKRVNKNLVYRALSPHYLHIDIIEILFTSDLDPAFFMYTERRLLETPSREHETIVPAYKYLAPINTFLNIGEYIHRLSVEKFKECLYLVLMKGVSVNAAHDQELPPLVWLHYCPHVHCFEDVVDILVQQGCNVDYCSSAHTHTVRLKKKLASYPLIFNNVDKINLSNIAYLPDAFFASLLIDPTTLYYMIPYSLQCDPGLMLKFAYDTGVIERFSNFTMKRLIAMIDSDCEYTSYDVFKYHVPPLKHLSRLQVRNIIKNKDGTMKTTQQFLDIVNNLPLPKLIKNYLRFL